MAVTFFFAFVAGLALIGIAAWLVRRFASNRLGANPNRGRMPRLAVIDAAAVDGRRRLVLVRRDNIEHLLMIGGPTDIVVESNIVRAVPARDHLQQRPSLPGVTAPEPPRITPLPGTAWSETEAQRAEAFDHPEPQMPEPPPRPVRPSFAEELRRPAPVAPERPGLGAESLSLRAEPKLEPRPEAMPPRMPSRAEPAMPRPSRWSDTPKPPPVRAPERAAAPPPPPPSPESADQNLAEMAHRLEAALRRPAAAPSTDTAPPVAPEAPPRDRAAAPQSEQPAAPPVPPPSPKSSFENLEDEMASLLGRSKS